MAALSRCSRFLLSRALYTPNRLALTRILRNDNKVFLPHSSTTQPNFRSLVSTGVDINVIETKTPTPDFKYKDCFHNLETWLNKYRQVSPFNVRLCMEKIQKDGIGYSHEGLMMLRATGEPLCDYHPDKRIALTNEVWDCITSSGLKLGTNHYNALITVYLENEHKFSPPDIIEQMENSGVIPNRITFQLLIAAYCGTGDIEKASQILEHMKDHNIPLTDSVFNNLIHGHFRINDPEGAQSMVELMKQSGLEPTSETYASLIKGYGEIKDLDSINKVFSEAAESQVIIQSYHLMEGLFSAVASGNEDIAYQILDKIKDSGRTFHAPLRRVVLKLTTHGHVDAAYKLYTDNFENSDLLKSIQRAVIINLDSEKYDEKLKTMISDDQQTDCQSLLRIASNERRLDWVLMLLKEYKESFSKPLSSVYHIITDCAKTGDLDGLMKIESEIALVDGSVDHYLLKVFIPKVVVPPLAKDGVPVDKLCAALMDKGFDVLASTTESIWLFYNDPDKALEHGKDNPMILNNAVGDAIRYNADLKTQWEGILQVVKKSSRYHNVKVSMLENILKENPDKAIEIMKYCNSQKIELTYAVKGTLKDLDLLEEANKEGIFQTRSSQKTDVNISQLSVKELESVVKEKPHYISAKIMLISKLLFSKKIDKAAAVLKSLEDLHTDVPVPSYIANVSGLKIYSLHKKDLELALKYLCNIEQLEEDGRIGSEHCNTFYHLLGLMIDEGKLEDTIPHIKQYVRYHSDRNRLSIVCITAVVSSLARNLKPVEAFDYLQKLINLQFIHPDYKHPWIRCLFDEYCKRRDSDALVELCKDMLKTRFNTPLFTVMNALIEKEDERCLQEVVDIFSPVYNEVFVLLNLMCSLVYNNKLSQARAVAKLPGLWGDMKVIDFCANGFVQDKKVKELEELVDLTKDVDGCNRSVMLGKLIKGYIKVKDYQAAKDVLDKFKNENIIPPAEILEFLAENLRANGLEVDFYVPLAKSEKVGVDTAAGQTSKGSPNLLSEVNEIIALFKSDGDYKEYLQSLFDGDLYESNGSKAKLLKQLQEHLPRQDFGKVLCWLYDSGKRDLLGLLGKDQGHWGLLALEMMNRSPADLIEMLQTVKAENLQKYLSLSLLSNLKKKSPEDYETVINIIRSLGVKGGNAVGLLWLQHVTDLEFDRATAVLEDLPERIKSDLLKSIKVYNICKKEVRNQKDDVLLHLLDAMKEFKGKTLKLHGYLLEVYTRQNDIEKTKALMTRLQDEGHEFGQITPSVRQAVKSLYQKHGLSVPSEMVKSSTSDEQNGQSSVEPDQVSHEVS